MRVVGLIAVALLCAQHAAAAESVQRSAKADPKGEVVIRNVAGSVEVRGWTRAEVEVEADLGSGVEKLDFQSDGARTSIQVVLPRGRSSGGGASDLIVSVPRDSSLSITTVSADQIISNVRGAQRLQAVSGGIETQVWDREIEVKTVSGDVTVDGQGDQAPATVATVSGDMRLSGVGRELDLNTVTGDMHVRAERIDRARIKTTNGDLELSASLGPEARLDAEAINGDLLMTFLGSIDAEFDIETFNGTIDNCFGPEPRRSREYGPGNELRFTEGKGAGRVRIKTLNGTVEVCRK